MKKWLTSSFLLWFAVCLFNPDPANGEQLSFNFGEEEKNLIEVLQGYSNKFSVGLSAGIEYRIVRKEFTDTVNGRQVTRVTKQGESLGLITMTTLKYQLKPYLRGFGAYGLAHSRFDERNQVAALGLEYTGLLIGKSYAGITLAVGCDVDNLPTLFNNLEIYDCFIMLPVVIGGDILDF